MKLNMQIENKMAYPMMYLVFLYLWIDKYITNWKMYIFRHPVLSLTQQMVKNIVVDASDNLSYYHTNCVLDD